MPVGVGGFCSDAKSFLAAMCESGRIYVVFERSPESKKVARDSQWTVVMNNSETDQILDHLKRIDANVGGLDTRMSEVQHGLATLAASTMAQFAKADTRFDKVDAQFAKVDVQFAKVDVRFNRVDRKIDGLRTELVGHMERIHDELSGRIVDLENPPRGGTGGSVIAS